MVMAQLIRLKNARNFSSALYITGDKAQTNFVMLIPHVDFDEQIKHKSELINNIKARRLNIDLEKIEKRWNFYKMIDDHKIILETTRAEIRNLINKMKEDPEKNKNEIEKLTLHSQLVKDDLKNVKEYSYGIEENANLAVLALPNILHPQTPIDHETVAYEFLQKPTNQSQSHMEIGKTNNLLEYIHPLFYFLKSDASLFEFALSNYFKNSLSDLNFIQFSNPDFARSIIVEGCGIDYLNKSKIFTLEKHDSDKIQEISRLHLVGGASIYSFMAYFARHSVQPSHLPLKLFAMGRNYKPVTNSNQFDLFTVNQQTSTNVFLATEDDDKSMEDLLNYLKQVIIQIYEPLGYHFRLVYVPAFDLDIMESLRLSIQMYSNHFDKYVEIGKVSVYDKYLSKRLLFTYTLNKERRFTNVIAGELLNVQRFLGCALENNILDNKPLLNALLQKHL